MSSGVSSSAESWLLFGSGPGSLVLAERLSARGHQVTLLNPQRQWGGVFAGTALGQEGEIFDNGMTNFELELFGEPRDDLQSYDPDARDSVGKYVHFVRDYLHRFVTTHEVPCPQTLWNGRLYPDLLITNRFDVLAALTPSLKDSVASELRAIVGAPTPLHARHKTEDPAAFLRRSFEEVSLANHGPTFHRLFVEPLFEKVLGVSTAEVPALFHRSGWAPLFYPETLLSQFGPQPQILKRTVFHYPDDRYFGAFLRRLLETVRARPGVRIVEGVTDLAVDAGRRAATTAQGCFEYDHLVWGGDLRPLAAASSPRSETSPSPEVPARASLRLHFLRVRREGLRNRFSVLIDPDPTAPFYRVTNQSLSGGRDPEIHQLILECNSDRWQNAPGTDEEKLDAALARYGIDRDAVIGRDQRTFAKALAIPSEAQRQQFNALRGELRRALPDVRWVGPGSGYSSVTLNDQIIQALQIAHEHEVLN